MKAGGGHSSRPKSHVAVIDRTWSNMYRCHSDLVKSNATLKDRSELNQKAFSKCYIFGC
jgi:hypothetical protein